jgi:hypothetical protein
MAWFLVKAQGQLYICLYIAPQGQHLNNQNLILLQSIKGKTTLEAERDQVHTKQIAKNC